MEPQISIIIPVYNTGKYLKKCLQSVIEQKIADIEIIIVNDASTDDSIKIIKKFAAHDKRFTIIDKKNNEGVEAARLTGINSATGTFLCFMDSDDWLPRNALRILLQHAKKTEADIVVGHHTRVLDRLGLVKTVGKKFCMQPLILDYDSFMRNYYVNFFGVNIFPVSMCGKLYRRILINRSTINTHGYNFGEDLMFNIQVFPQSKKTVLVPDLVYNYRYGGMTSKFNSQLIPSQLRMYKQKQEFAVRYHNDSLNKFSQIELKNYLKTFIEMLLKFKGDESSVVHKRQIAEVIATEEFIDLKNYYASQELQGFELALAKGDVDGMYMEIIAEYKKIKLLYKLKRLLSSIFN